MGRRRPWTEREIEYLCDNWGIKSIPTICKKLNRTETAVQVKSERLKLEGCYLASGYLSARATSKILNIDIHVVTDFWIAKYGLKAKKRKLKNAYQWFIDLDDLVKWLKENQDKWDSRKVELYALGTEPIWLKEKRTRDMKLPKRGKKKWTPGEESQLKSYCSMGKSYQEIAVLMQRSEKAIKERACKLKAKGLIPYSEKYRIAKKWRENHEQI